MTPPEGALAAQSPRSIDAILDWTPDTLPAVATLLGLRRYWMGPVFQALRRDYEAAVGDGPGPATQAEAEPIVQALPSARYFQWLHRHIQDRTWALCRRIARDRAEELAAALSTRPDDLGTLTVDGADLPVEIPAYYTFDYHRQDGGIWRGLEGAAVYLLGARIVHAGRNTDFQLHDQVVGDIPVEAPPRRILDLGCGFGKTTFSLKARWPDAQVTGVDLADPCLRLGRRMASERGLAIDWRHGDMERLTDADGSADLVVITMVLHEMPESAIRAALRECTRVLKPGGRLAMLENRLIGDPFRDTLLKWYSQLIDEPYWEPYRHMDLPGACADAGLVEAETRSWYLANTGGPEAEADPRRWCTPWGLTLAKKPA